MLDHIETDEFDVSDDVLDELNRANAKFPLQSFEWGGDPGYKLNADHYKAINDSRTLHGRTHTWMRILGEEFFEAAAETDPERIYAELLQVGAMAIRAAADIKRRAEGGQTV